MDGESASLAAPDKTACFLVNSRYIIVNASSYTGSTMSKRTLKTEVLVVGGGTSGVCAALQIYNVVCIFIPHGIIVEQGQNVASDSALAVAAFWIMNLMWVLAASAVLFLAHRRIFELNKSNNNI